ncbi:MAG: alpha-amylase family glycosyl hydrolase [Verrucomicrobiota bacterium JB025]
MGDFYQNGQVTTLHHLTERPLRQVEADLMEFRKTRPMALVLPSLYSELEGHALPMIVDELSHVPYLDQIVVGLDRATEDQYRHALEFFNRLPQRPQVLWNDGPRLKKIDAILHSHGLAPEEMGKGRNVWYMFGYILATGRAQAVALHDCDITTYKRDLLARLIYPVANPGFSFKFCKGYYARVAKGSMNGRVCRLLVTPLIRALKKVCGPNDYLDYLDGFRYPLAGEFSLQRDVIEDIRIPSDWGLEMGVISEMQRNYSTRMICQVDIAETYDHKHQDLSADDRDKGLSKMASDISKSLFRKMATQGTVFSAETIRTIKATYFRMALDLVDSYHADAELNGLNYDRHKENQAVELFSENILDAGSKFLEHSMATPFMPSWKRVIAAVPDIFDQLLEAVDADANEYGSAEVINPSLHPGALRLRQRVSLHLEELYGKDGQGKLTDRLLTVAGLKSQPTHQAANARKWNQKDVIMITYGDSIIDEGHTPLKSLYRFMNRELKGVISGVHILPFSPYSSDDGFSVIDYNEVNPDLGTWDDIKMIGADYKLMADLVVNHCSSESKWFKNYLRGEAPGKDYFIEQPPDTDLSEVVRPRSSPLLTKVETVDGEKHVWCTFSADQVDLNYANPEVLFEMVRIIRDYIEKGIRFFRLDAVAFVWKEPGTSCVHLPQTHELIKLLRLVIENLEPAAVVITETNVPNRENLSYFGNDNEAHLIYNFSLPPLLINALLTGSSKYLKSWMMSMPPARRGRGYLNFIASHDGIGVRPAEGLLSESEQEDLLGTLQSFGGHISMRRMPDGVEKPYEVNISLFDAFKGMVGKGPDEWQAERFLCAHTILLALEGIPAIYIHSMLGTENDHEGVARTGRNRSINRRKWKASELDEALQDEGKPHGRVFAEMKRRIKIRTAQAAFHPNATQYTLHFGDEIFGFWRESIKRDQSVFALHNISDKPQQVSLVELNLIGTESWRDLLTDTIFDNIGQAVTLEPYQCMWISNR